MLARFTRQGSLLFRPILDSGCHSVMIDVATGPGSPP
jgi:hypothetical protein